MSIVSKALDLAELGIWVFPLNSNKTPLRGSSGLHDAIRDPNIIRDQFEKAAYVGVNTGKSGLIALDIDKKNGKNGFDRLEEQWLLVEDTWNYETPNGGEHHIYLAPDDDYYGPAVDYRGLEGVDRRSGGSYVVWYGEVPGNRGAFSTAPDWLCEATIKATRNEYEGDLDQWISELTEGEPSLYVRRALDKLAEHDDLSHSDMVAAQFNAVRLGAEGHPGVTKLLEAIKVAWLNRDPANHTTPQSEWLGKYEESLDSAIRKYGRQIEQIANLPKDDVDLLPNREFNLFVGEDAATPSEWSRALGALVDKFDNDDFVAAALWGAPRTSHLAREWGIEFVHQRIDGARQRPEPIRENPSIEEVLPPEPGIEPEVEDRGLLTAQERNYLAVRPNFADDYIAEMKKTGFVQEDYARTCAWNILSMAYSFAYYIPKSGTQNMNLNLWFIVTGESGSGKSVTARQRDRVLNRFFETLAYLSNNGDTSEAGNYWVGSDFSIPGLTQALLERDGKATLLSLDEATRFFKQLRTNDWQAGVDNTLAHWYEGRVDPSNKVRLKELSGKSATTSFNIHMFATPDEFFAQLDREMFKSGFLARVNWLLGPPKVVTEDRFVIRQDDSAGARSYSQDRNEVLGIVEELLLDNESSPGEAAILMTKPAQERLSAAYRDMYRASENKENWDIVEPSITRLSETLHKLAAICAIYRGSQEIELVDALQSISEVERWYEALLVAANRVSAGEFQRDVDAIEEYVRNNRTVSHAKLYHSFRNMIQRNSRELDDRVNFLIESGRVNRTADRGNTHYTINGG